jgi:uncharacterized Rmd1/YagE family protein
MQVKLAISHALAQSTKLHVHEQTVIHLVTETNNIPQLLASEVRLMMPYHCSSWSQRYAS